MKHRHRFAFTRARLGTVGVEMEWFLVDTATGAQAPLAPELIDACACPKRIKAELFTSIVELNTGIHESAAGCVAELASLVELAHRRIRPRNAGLLASGTHPFSHWKDQRISPDPRYDRLVQRLQWMARRFNICGIHVHIGMPDGDACIRTMNGLLPVMPAFLAISANSPFWHGDDTGLAAARIKVFEGLSQGGMPFYFRDWQDFEHCASRLLASGSIDSVRDIWWEMRPHPDFGTLEIRIGDMPGQREDAAAYIAYVRAETLAAFGEGACPRVHPSLIRENRWRACRYGLAMEWIDPFTETPVPFLDWLEKRLDTLANHGADLADLDLVGRRLPHWRKTGGGAERQRRLAASGFPAMIMHMMNEDGWPR